MSPRGGAEEMVLGVEDPLFGLFRPRGCDASGTPGM